MPVKLRLDIFYFHAHSYYTTRAYATRVEAVADSYLQVGGRAPTVL
jgi:hypothetical protein